MKRGDVVLVDLDPVLGSETSKRRPAIMVSNDDANRGAMSRGRGVVTVAPVTSSTTRVYPFQVRLPADRATGLTAESKCRCEQVRSIDVTRVVKRLGALPLEQLRQIDDALRLHLQL